MDDTKNLLAATAISAPSRRTWPQQFGSFTSALLAELRAWQIALCAWQLYVLLGILLVGLLLAVQLPLHYRIDVGVGEGYGGDLPVLHGFNDAEHDEHGTYRWTTDGAQILLPGVGSRPLLVRMRFFPVGAQVMAVGPKVIEVWSNAGRLATLPVRPEGASYSLPVPPELVKDGDLALTIHTATFAPGGDDPRRLGTPLDRVEVDSLDVAGLAWPNWRTTAAWLLAVLLAWALVVRAGFVPREALLIVGVGVVLALVAAVLDPPRFAFGAVPGVVAVALAYGLVVGTRAATRAATGEPPYRAAEAAGAAIIDARALRWLLLIVAVAFAMRYGGRLYPESMGGDIGFHYNRMTEVIKGRIFILSRNRGVDFPYPPGPYIVLLPFVLLGLDPQVVLQLGAALVEALSAVLVYVLVANVLTKDAQRSGEETATILPNSHFPSLITHHSTALLAAAIYVFTAAGFMTTWWSFDTHIYTQFATLLLITVVVLGLLQDERRKIEDRRQEVSSSVFRLRSSALSLPSFIAVLLAIVFLGHFGFFINTALLGGLLLLVTWVAAWRGNEWARAAWRSLTFAYVAALLVALLFFYSAFAPLLIAQAQAAATGGLTGLAQRDPVPRSVLWQVLWEAGFITHFGFFPLLLAPVGLWMGWGPRTKDKGRKSDDVIRPSSLVLRPRLVLFALMTGSFLVSSFFALLPFITQSTQSTRWLMFSAWAVAITGAVAVRRLWRYGWVGKLVVLAMAGFVLWNTAAIWLGALAWRVRPPEPF